MVGGTGERKTLRLVAQYADACNFFLAEPDEIAHELDVHASLPSMKQYAALGVSQIWVGPDPDDPVG